MALQPYCLSIVPTDFSPVLSASILMPFLDPLTSPMSHSLCLVPFPLKPTSVPIHQWILPKLALYTCPPLFWIWHYFLCLCPSVFTGMYFSCRYLSILDSHLNAWVCFPFLSIELHSGTDRAGCCPLCLSCYTCMGRSFVCSAYVHWLFTEHWT